MRKINYDKLPKINVINNRIDWGKSIGYSVDFEYDDLIGTVDIVDYKNYYLYIKYLDNQPFRIHHASFKNCKLGKLLNIFTDQFKIEIDTEFKDSKRDLKIVAREKRGVYKYYKYLCNKCKYSQFIEESNLIKGIGCACCAGKVVVKGVNDIATTKPDLIKYFDNTEDGYKYTYSSSRKIMCKCDYCGCKKEMSPNKLSQYGFSCPKCSDGISYPEKFINSLFTQICDNYIYQLSKTTLKWCGSYKYDFAILNKSCIVEVHGLNHYSENNFSSLGGKTLKEEQENDINKEFRARENNIKNYIIIDARLSNLEWIKKSVMASDLPKLMNFSEKDIDWSECHREALSNLVKVACDYKKHDPQLSTSDIAMKMRLSNTAILTYLKNGSILGWCEYDPIKERNKGLMLGWGITNKE